MMIKTQAELMDELKGYASPKARLTRLLKAGKLIQLRRGLFADDPAVSRRVVAAALYGPSYISFQYALAAAGLIPERVTVVTSASFNKNKNKVFRTPLGEFRYFYLPPAVYPYGIKMETGEGASYLIASAEKALCDAVYKVPEVTSVKRMNVLLLEDWRIDREAIIKLDGEFIRQIAPMYRRKSLNVLAAWFSKNTGTQNE
jgi:predicted transcriptional regulator of viral defense system